jgi:hypothetical protein
MDTANIVKTGVTLVPEATHISRSDGFREP